MQATPEVISVFVKILDIVDVVEIELVIALGETELVTGQAMAMAVHTVPDWQTGTQ